MARLIPKPTVIEAAGNKPKLIEEYFGRVNSGTTAASIARMRSPGGWVEPGQTPEFDEYTVVLRGELEVKTKAGTITVKVTLRPMFGRGGWLLGDGRDALELNPNCKSMCNGEDGGLWGGNGGSGAQGGNGGGLEKGTAFHGGKRNAGLPTVLRMR